MQAGPKDKFTLRQVVELTALSEFSLRGWESRYRAFSPRRTDSGRRIYTQIDVQKALALKSLTERGRKISEIAGLNLEQLEELVGVVNVSAPTVYGARNAELKELFSYIERQAWKELHDSLDAKLKKKRGTNGIPAFILPLLEMIGVGVAKGMISVAQEHIASAMLKEQLYLMRRRFKRGRVSVRLLMAAPEGDMHDLGLLIAYNLAVASGCEVLYLGPNTPKRELCEVAVRFDATHVLVASAIREEAAPKESFLSFLNYLDRNLPALTHLWLGGRAVFSLEPRMKRECRIFQSLPDLELALGELA